MSGAVRAGLLFGLAASLAFIAGMFIPIPCVNVIVALGSVVALGWGAGKTAAKTTGAGAGQGVGRGLTAGAIGGLVTLIATTVIFLLLAPLLNSLPGFQEGLNQALQQSPEAGDLTSEDIGAVLGVGLGIVGFGCGIVNFLLMLIGGAIGGAMWKGTPAAAGYAPAGGTAYTPPSAGYNPPQTSEGGARVYDPNDPNRPQ